MTPTEAATLIGCHVRHVRALCKQGVIKSRRRQTPGGFYYVVDPDSAMEYANKPQTQGFPRGQKRT